MGHFFHHERIDPHVPLPVTVCYLTRTSRTGRTPVPRQHRPRARFGRAPGPGRRRDSSRLGAGESTAASRVRVGPVRLGVPLNPSRRTRFNDCPTVTVTAERWHGGHRPGPRYRDRSTRNLKRPAPGPGPRDRGYTAAAAGPASESPGPPPPFGSLRPEARPRA